MLTNALILFGDHAVAFSPIETIRKEGSLLLICFLIAAALFVSVLVIARIIMKRRNTAEDSKKKTGTDVASDMEVDSSEKNDSEDMAN